MKIFWLLPLIALVALLSGCNENAATSQPGQGDTAFQRISENFLPGYLAWRPEIAVGLGFHEYDGKISNFSKGSTSGELATLNNSLQDLAAIDTSTLSARVLYDYRILQNGISKEIFNIQELNPYAKNPMLYAGSIDMNVYIKRDFAPIEDRIKSIIAIELKTPDVFAAAKANLEDSLGKPLIETAIEVANGTAAFLGKDLIVALKNVKNDSLMTAFRAANQKAIDELKGYVTWLEKEKLPKAQNHYGIGSAKYQKMLNGELISLPPERILEMGLSELNKEQDQFNAAAKIINPAKNPIDVYHDLQKEHPVADSLIPDARRDLEAIRQFLIDKNIVTMPSEVRIQVRESPEYIRSTSSASMDPPGPFEKKATEAYYYITPVESKWTAKQKEDWLSQFDYYTTDNTTIHEAYPGHYTQFLHLNASAASKIEKIFYSYAFVEGWAHYVERMMVEEGYGHTGDSIKAAKYHLAQSGDALLRLCRLCVSVKTHCQGMSLDEATQFFMDNWHQGKKPSMQEAIRGVFDPGYCFYTLGKLQILKLRDDFQRQEGPNFTLKKFNDAMIDNGMPPIRLLREIMLKDSSKWEQIF